MSLRFAALHCTASRLKRIRQSKIFQWCSSRSRSPHPSQPDIDRCNRSVGAGEGRAGEGRRDRGEERGGKEGQGREDGKRERRGEGKRGEERRRETGEGNMND